jgi:hypothetical protein
MPENSRGDSRRLSLKARARAGAYASSTLSITLLVAVTAIAAASPTAAHAASPAAFSAQVAKPPPTVWGACPTLNRAGAEHKLVRRFDRATGVTATGVTMPAGPSDLLCGTDNYGYYHLVARHHAEWMQKSVLTNQNWREVADYSIAEALRSPKTITFRARNNTFCYSREISLIDKVRGVTVDVMHPNVVVRAQDGAVITVYPPRSPCPS